MISVAASAALALAAGPPMTAPQALRAGRAATSIGPDPCRRGGDEIVVCGTVTTPYGVPWYRDDEAGAREAPGTQAGNIAAARDAGAACHARGETCLHPLPVVTVSVGPGKKNGVRVGKD